jgi:hypothetical protein
MRAVPFIIGSTDAVHIYSDAETIRLQLRRDVPTEQSIVKPSFKVALSLTPNQAIAIAGELLTAATLKRSQPNGTRKQLSAPKSQPPKPVSK